MLKIRLKRIGRRGDPHYRIVVIESSKGRDGRPIEDLGSYSPRSNPKVFEVDQEKATAWLNNGAQPTDTVAQHFVKLGIIKSLKRGSHKPNTDKKTKEQK